MSTFRSCIATVFVIATASCWPGSTSGQEAPKNNQLPPHSGRPAAERADSATLFEAAAHLYSKGRLEGAGFLFYAGQMRAQIDLQVYEPVGTGGNDPALAIAAASGQLGAEINPSVMRDREAFARIIDRLEKWSPVYDPKYQPGWEYKLALQEAEFDIVVRELKLDSIGRLRSFNELLHDDNYYAAFKTIQDYNLGEAFQSPEKETTSGAKSRKVSKAEYTAAMKRLKQIEKERGIESGLFPDEKTTGRSRKTDYKVRQKKVMYGRQEVAGADPAMFEVLSDVEYAKDGKRVYIMGFVIPGADPKTFQIIESPYSRDKSALYCGNVRMDIDSLANFQVVLSSSSWRMALLDADAPTVVGDAWARDDKNWYYGPDVVTGADYDSFKPIDGFYAEDKYQKYMGRDPMDSLPAWVREP